MKSRQSRILLAVAGVLIALVVGLGLASMAPPPPPPMPSPNGYLDFLKASQLLPAALPDYSELNEDQLRREVAKNEDALQLIRTGLTRECRVPVGVSTDEMSSHLQDLASLKRLAQALEAGARLADLEHRNADAAKARLEIIRLGQEAMRGGVLIDALVGIACQTIGSSGLERTLTNFDAGICRKVIGELEEIDRKHVSYDEVKNNEQQWARRSFPLYQRAIANVMRLFNVSHLEQVDQKLLLQFQTQEKRLRGLTINLAARAFELEKGQPPRGIAELVPDYLQAMPKDPFTGTNMVYQRR